MIHMIWHKKKQTWYNVRQTGMTQREYIGNGMIYDMGKQICYGTTK